MEKVNIGFDIDNDSNSLISMHRTHKDYDYCVSNFIIKILLNIEQHLKHKKISDNLSTIGITGEFNGTSACDIKIDGESFFVENNNGESLIARLAEKAIQVIRFNYDISEDEEIKVHVVTRSEIEHGLYFCFRFISSKLDITLDKDTKFPVMKKPAIDALLKFKDVNIKLSADYKEHYSFKNIYDLLADGYAVDSKLATKVFEKFEHEIDTTMCRMAMKAYLDSITPSNVISEIGYKEAGEGNVFAVVSKLKNNSAKISHEDYDAFEIVIKVKSPKCAELDIMDIRNQFAMKYPELKDDIVLTKKVDVQGNIASILETKLKYDAMFILTNNYVNKENMIMSTIKDKEVVGNTEKEDFDRAVNNVRNSIVTEIKK